jgi:MFS family permease
MPPRLRLGLPVALVTAMTVGTAGQFIAPILGPLFLPEFGLGRTQLGFLTAVFYAVGAVASPPAGRLADRSGDRTSMVLTFALGGAGLAVMGLAPGYAAVVLGIAVTGLAAAMANPATNRLVLASYPPGRRGAITGLKQSGVQLGTLLAGVALPPLALAVGWRAALVISGAIAASGALLSLAVVPRTEHAIQRHSPTTDADGGGTQLVLTLCVFAALMGLGIAAVTTYLPIYTIEALDLTLTRAGIITGTIGALGIAARLFWGVTADRLGAPVRVLPILAGGATVGVGLLAAAPTVGTWALWVGAAVFGATAMGWNGVAMLVAMTAVPPARTGWATGRVILAFYLGLVASPIPFGMVADRTGSYLAGWIAVAVAFVGAGITVAVRARR